MSAKTAKFSGFLSAASELGDTTSGSGGQNSKSRKQNSAGSKRPRPAASNSGDADNADEENEGGVLEDYERIRRDTRPEWRFDEANRLPVKMADGTFKKPEQRPRQHRAGTVAGGQVQRSAHSDTEEDDNDEDDGVDVSSESGDDEGSDGGDENEVYESDDDKAKGPKHKRGKPEQAAAAAAPVDPDAAIKTFAQLSALPPAQLQARRARLKLKIAEYSERVISDPEHNISAAANGGKDGDRDDDDGRRGPFGKAGRAAAAAEKGKFGKFGGKDAKSRGSSKKNTLLALHQLCSDPDPVIRKLAMVSATAVIKDILPGYRIRQLTEKEKDTKVKKDVKRLRDHENAILKGYQRFLKFLENTAVAGEKAGRAMAKASARGGDGGFNDAASTSTGHSNPSGATGSFDADANPEGAADDDGAASSKSKPSRFHVSQKEFNKQKMDDKRAKAAAAAGIQHYDADNATLHALGLVAVRSMGELLSSAPHFNFRTNIIDFLVPRMSSRDDEFCSGAAHGVERLFADDHSFEASLEASKALSKFTSDSVSSRGPPKLRARALTVLYKIPLKVLEQIDSNRENKRTKYGGNGDVRKNGKKSKDEKAEEADIEAGLRAADAESLHERRKFAKATLKQVIAIYFRILRSPSHAFLLPEVLQGLAKFAHLIDVGVVTDLLASLKHLLKSGMEDDDHDQLADDGAGAAGAPSAQSHSSDSSSRVRLSISSALNCVLTALRIMAGPGELLNADETDFAHFLYGSLPRLLTSQLASQADEYALLACYCVQALLLNRREYSNERVAAFAKRCLTLAVHMPTPASTLALLNTARSLAHRYPTVSSLFNSSNSAASGKNAALAASSSAAAARDVSMTLASGSRSALFDCDHSNGGGTALSAVAWEIAILQNHYHPEVRSAANAAASASSLAPSDQPAAVFRDFDSSGGVFNPPIALPKPHPLANKIAAVGAGADDGEGGAGGDTTSHSKHHDRKSGTDRRRLYFVRPRAAGIQLPASVVATDATIGSIAVPDAAFLRAFESKQARLEANLEETMELVSTEMRIYGKNGGKMTVAQQADE